MSRSTGPVLAIGAVTVANSVVLNGKTLDIRVPIATGIAAGGFALLERVSESLAVGLAWTALVAALFVRIDPRTPSPVESFNAWWQKG